MSRKDSRAMFNNILLTPPTGETSTAPGSSSPHLRKVAAGIRHLQEREEMVDRLLKEGDRIVELDSEDIAPSGIQDRFDGTYEQAAISELVESIREKGQIVPGLVRPASGDHHYQIVFGRRRLAAARQLGIPFRAIVRQLSDEEAIIFQGEENTNREDLTFVERCLFAHAQEAAGFGREVICKSLSTSKSHLSEMLRLTSTVPRKTLVSIGRAPDVGRRRWLEFADLWLARHAAEDIVEVALDGGPDPVAAGKRFAAAFSALKRATEATTTNAVARIEVMADGQVLATLDKSKTGANLRFSKEIAPGFAQFVAEQMPELHSRYMKLKTEG